MGEEINENKLFAIHRSSILDSILSVLGGSLILLRTFGSEFLAYKNKSKNLQFGCLNFQNLRTSAFGILRYFKEWSIS
jgi:hypothetical protein